MYINETERRFSAKKDLFGGSWGGGEHIYLFIFTASYIKNVVIVIINRVDVHGHSEHSKPFLLLSFGTAALIK